MVTNYIKNASYKEIYDLHTDSESSSFLTLHCPVSNIPRKMLSGFFQQYRKFKYKGARVTLRPASRLPADPAQLSYSAGEPAIDARDMLNPILYRGYSGESLGYFLNVWGSPGYNASNIRTSTTEVSAYQGSGFFGDSIDKISFPETIGLNPGDDRTTYLEKLYYQSLSDPGFKKLPPQKGMSKFFYPLVYELATTTQRLSNANVSASVNRQVYAPASTSQENLVISSRNDMPDVNESRDAPVPVTSGNGSGDSFISAADEYSLSTSPFGATTTSVRYVRRTVPILTSHKRRLGWLDTDTKVVGPYAPDETAETYGITPSQGTSVQSSGFSGISVKNSTLESLFPNLVVKNTTLPLINMGVFCLPKSYKTEMYYRVTVQHYFDFKEYRPTFGLVSPFDTASMDGPSLEWNDWDTSFVFPSPSITSTAKNVDLVDVTQ